MVVGNPFAITCTDDSRVEIDPGDECLAEPNVRRSPEDRPERVHDVRRVQEGGGNLVEERSEQVVVVPVDEEHVHGSVVELPRAGQAAESPTDDDRSEE